MTSGGSQALARVTHLPRATQGWGRSHYSCPDPRVWHAAGHKTAPETHTGKTEGRERGAGGEAALRGNCQPDHQQLPVAMTTPSCVASRNKLLIVDTASPPPRSPQCPLGRHHFSPLLHLFCICLEARPSETKTEPQKDHKPPTPRSSQSPPRLTVSLAIMDPCCSVHPRSGWNGGPPPPTHLLKS